MERAMFRFDVEPSRPHQNGYYYLFLHLEPEGGYTLQALGLYRFKTLAPPSPTNRSVLAYM